MGKHVQFHCQRPFSTELQEFCTCHFFKEEALKSLNENLTVGKLSILLCTSYNLYFISYSNKWQEMLLIFYTMYLLQNNFFKIKLKVDIAVCIISNLKVLNAKEL